MRRIILSLTVLNLLAIPAIAQEADIEELEERAMQAAVTSIQRSVVRIETFGGLQRVGRMLVGTGPTTGLIVSEDGYVASSMFNFVQKPNSILVKLPDGTRAAAKIVARDRSRMLVLLKVNTKKKLPVPKFAPAKDVVVGQWAVAVGKALDAKGPNISIGIVSAKNRIWGRAVQTDAKISPANYGGPLIDLQGRVYGLLVPLSPRGGSELAGAEWYDSGIGFAVPLQRFLSRLPDMKKGKDLHPGILGISLKGNNQFSDPAVVAACQRKSPAYEAGLRVGDRIVEADGQPIVRQAQLKHVLGPLYAGDSVNLVVLRAGKRHSFKPKLIDKLVPYAHPFIGILPIRDNPATVGGVVVRHVFANSPAARLGIKVGDKITKFEGKAVATADQLRLALSGFEPKAKVKLEVESGGNKKTSEIELVGLPTTIPESLAAVPTSKPTRNVPATGKINVKIPEERNKCVAYIPPNYNPAQSYGVVVWIHPPSQADPKEAIDIWKAVCAERQLILLAPQAANPARWSATEVEFIRKALAELSDGYTVDPNRIVAHGYRAGGAMAFLFGFTHRNRVRGVASIEAPVPQRARPPANDPIQRMAIYAAFPQRGRAAARLRIQVKALTDLKYPVTTRTLPKSRYLTSSEIAELARWIDLLDRL